MSRELKRKGPIGLGRSPESDTRQRRNSDTNSSYLQICEGVPDIDLNAVGNLSAPEQALVTILARMKVLQDAHNALLTTLRGGEVIGREQ